MHGLHHTPEGIDLEGAWGWGRGTSSRPRRPQGAALKKGGLGPHCRCIWRRAGQVLSKVLSCWDIL